jgi:hypothetical protein
MMQASRPSWTIVAHGRPTAAAGISFTGPRSIRRRFDRKALSRKAGHMAAKFKNEHFKDGGLLFGVFNPKR